MLEQGAVQMALTDQRPPRTTQDHDDQDHDDQDHDDMTFEESQQAERIASVKAGIVAAVGVGLVFAVTVGVNHQVLAVTFPQLWVLQMQGINWQGVGSGAIALISGFLFGVTYRYIVRADDNPHLRSGAVMAFGLVRGLAQVDVGVMANGTPWPFVVLALESFMLFAITRVLLDVCFRHGWIQPFEG